MWEVQHYTLCDGWVNTWTCEQDGNEVPWQFETKEGAEEELSYFFEEVRLDIQEGRRQPDEGYDWDEFQIVEVGAADSHGISQCEEV